MLNVYNITAITFFLFSLIFWGKNVNNTNHRTVFALCLLWLVIFDGFRWQIGTDWDSYKSFFDNGDDDHMGAVYYYFNEVLHCFSDEYTIITLTIAIIMYSVVGLYYIKRYSVQPFMSLCIYFTSMVGLMGCNRQLLALMCCLISLKFIYERKLTCFCFLIVLATGFHITALLFLPAFFLLDCNYKNKYIIIAILCAFAVGLLHLVNKLPFAEYLALIDAKSSGTSLSVYFTNEKIFGVSIVGSFKRILFVLLALGARTRIQDKRYDFAVLMYSIGCIIYLCFNGSMLQILAGRGCMYFNIFEVIWVPYMITYFRFGDKTERKLIWMCFFLFYIYVMNRDMDSYFLQGGIDIYRPYKSILYKFL